jgi:hypothetical protein
MKPYECCSLVMMVTLKDHKFIYKNEIIQQKFSKKGNIPFSAAGMA